MASKLGILNLPPFLLEFPSPISLFLYIRKLPENLNWGWKFTRIGGKFNFQNFEPLFSPNASHIWRKPASHRLTVPFCPPQADFWTFRFWGRRDVKRPNDPTPYSSNNPGRDLVKRDLVKMELRNEMGIYLRCVTPFHESWRLQIFGIVWPIPSHLVCIFTQPPLLSFLTASAFGCNQSI